MSQKIGLLQLLITGYQELVAEMIKQSTDFLTKDFEKRNDDLKTELLKHVKDTLGNLPIRAN